MSYIDTIEVGFPVYLPINLVNNWPHQKRDLELETYRTTISTSDHKCITVTYHPKNKAGELSPFTIFQMSLPKMVRDCNHDLSYDQSQAIEKANSIMPSISGYPNLKIEDGKLVRLDLVYHHHVGNLVSDYLTILSRSDYLRRQTGPYKDCGVQYKSVEETAKFYDKYRLCKHPEIKGYLR